MCGKVRIWTRQNSGILEELRENGRYIVKKEYIAQKKEEHAGLYLDVYNWYACAASKLSPRPADVSYPIWVSLAPEEGLGASEGNVIIEVLVDRSRLITIDIDKWGYIVNYMYIPRDEADKEEHEKMLKRYGTDDCAAYMSGFYPHIKNKIIKSWERLFDDSITLSPVKVGTIWELRQEWITQIAK